MSDQPFSVVRIIAPDSQPPSKRPMVSCGDPAIAYLVGWTDDEVREFVYSKSWHAAHRETTVVPFGEQAKCAKRRN